MRLVTFQSNGGTKCGALNAEDRVVDLHAVDRSLPTSVWGYFGNAAAVVEAASLVESTPPLKEMPKLLAPVQSPGKILCIGLNYADHAKETGASIPAEPVVFNKLATTLCGPDAVVELPEVSSEVDYEAELVVVIGKSGKNIAEQSAMDHVFGYMAGNDISARDWQKGKPGKQWLLGKSFDNFAPTGPFVRTADEVPDPHALKIGLKLGGETLQDSSTDQLLFKIPKLISYISQVCTLHVGDLIFTGTPAGVGMARTPPRFLQPGDVAEVEIEGLGVLKTTFTAQE